MASYYELLKRPEWQKKRLEILDAAGFECTNCGSKDKTLHVHHCYYEKGKKPWEYPDNVFRCLCEDCHKKVEELKLATSQVMSKTYCDDEVYGYALGSYAFDNKDQLIHVETYEIALGLADRWGLGVESVVIPHLSKNNGKISGSHLMQLGPK